MPKKTLEGKVISDKMDKTVVVEVMRTYHHPRYKKRVEKHKKYKAHDSLGAKVGDVVQIEECRPLSKDKHFKVIRILADS
ncbi:MAG: 30S ribosomal protein S17 [Patescibacteria group bacterium]|nr:30S ribosomal protein S17 [Patescibacteria group bacterium]